MAKPILSFDVFQQSVNILKSFQKNEGETQKAYYERLQKNYGLKPSRATLQLIEKAMVGNDDVKEAHAKYKELTRKREADRKMRDKEKKEKEPEQQKMDIHMPVFAIPTEEENEALRIRVSFELGETAKKAIDGLLALVGVKL